MEDVKITKDAETSANASTGKGIPAVRQETPLANLGAKLGRGHEEPSSIDEIEIPRAKLIQFTSEENTTDNKEERKDAGTLINSLTGESLGNFFIPIFKFTNFIKWNPRKKDDPNFDAAFETGAMVFQTANNNDPRVVDGVKFGANGEPPAVTKYMNFLCYFVDHSMPLILSFSKSSFAAGKRLNSITQFGGGDMFSKKFRLGVKQEENAGTKYFVLSVHPAGVPTEKEFNQAEEWYSSFRGKTISVHTDEKKPEGWAGE